MSQATSGIRAFLAIPAVYDLFQEIIGLTEERKYWIREFLKPFSGARILDIGCGTATLLGLLPADVDYTGFDVSRAYIDAARRRHGSRGRFYCAKIEAAEAGRLDGPGPDAASFDIAMAFGVLHHLDDEEARQVFRGARRALKPDGRLVTLDPAFVPDQSVWSRFVVSHDRGRNVRFPEAYARLGRDAFHRIEVTVLPKILRIPADTAALVCRP